MSETPKRRRRKSEPAGVVEATPLDFLVIGRIARPVGLRGDVKVQVLSDIPDRFNRLQRVYVGRRLYTVRAGHAESGGVARLTLAGVTSREKAETLRGQLVEIPADEAEALPEGVYYHHQLVGLRALADTGEELGRVVEVVPTGANDVYVVRPAVGRDVLVPAIAEVIEAIDLAAGTLTVRILDGLLPDPPRERPGRSRHRGGPTVYPPPDSA